MERRLAAILAADMVGYSRLIGADEEGTITRQRAHREALIDPEIASHGGRIVKTMGDGVLVEFASVVEAVKCAVAVQEGMVEREADVPTDRRIQYRVGINLGDIVIDGDDILGDGVNVAARLEGLAEPGGICISDVVHQSIEGKLDLAFADMGAQQVKNIARPVRVYRVLLFGASNVFAGEPPLTDKPSIAVLPFDNLSGDPEQEYFSDGLAEDIITLLAAWRSFPVIARNSSFAFKGQSHDVRQIAKELSARYVIEGSVRKSGNRVRVTAQLIDAETGHHLWADKFDGALDDIFEIQDELTRCIVASVEPEMEQAELRKTATERAANLSAWDNFLRGRAHLYRMTRNDNAQARKLFESAIALDPDYSDAFAGLSFTYQRDIHLEFTEDRQACEREALKAARQAVALDNESSFAHFALSGAYIWSNQHDLSIAELRTAVELNPSNVHARLALGNRLDIVGKSEEGIPLLEKSLELHPRDPHSHTYFTQLGRAYINARNYDKALECLREALRRKDDHPHTYHVLAICLGHLGQIEEAQDAARRCEELRPGFIKRRAHWNIYLDPAANEHLTDGLRKAGLTEGVEAEVETPPLPDKPSIAVLPFDNLSGDPEQEYFSDGMAEDLITDLSKLSNLSVAARNSAFSFKGQMPEVSDVVAKLGVAYVLEGSVRKMGERLRINAQLIDGVDGRHIWAERYDGDMAEIFDFQDRIRGEIVAALEVQLTPFDEARTKRKPTNSVAAYDLFLKGRANLHIFTPEHFYEAIKRLEEAIGIDPKFADAYTVLSHCNFVGWVHMRPGFDDGLNRSNELAEKAVVLDGSSALALVTLSYDQTILRRYDPAIANLEKAIKLAANNADVYAISGQVLNYLGNPERGLEMLEKAFSLEVFAPPLWEFYAGVSRLLLRRYDEALANFNRGVEKIPKFTPAYPHLAWLYVELGRLDDARDAIKTVLELAPQFTVKKAAERWPYRVDEHCNRFLDALRKAGLPEGDEAGDTQPPLPDKPSIAVLPFDNLSDDTEQEYFADGISEDIITALSKFRSFFVIARHSTFTYKGQAVDVTRVGKELGVRYVLEGSVRKSGDRLRTSAQLVDAQSGNHVWAERYDGNVADIFDLQDDITTQIVGALVPEVDAAERARALRRPPEDVDTWVIFQRAMAHADRFNAEDNALATTLLKETIERDPGFVPAYAHLAVLRAQAARHGYASDPSAALDEAREYGQYAVSQDPNDAVAHLGLGIAAMFRGEGDVAIPEMKTAVDLNPNFARAYVWLGFAYSWCVGGMPETEIQFYDTALRLSPRDPWRWYCLMHKGSALRVLGQHEEAVALCQAACRFPETGFLPLLHLTVALVHAGRIDEARDAAADLLQIRPELTITIFKRMLSTLCPITLEPVLNALREAGLPEG